MIKKFISIANTLKPILNQHKVLVEGDDKILGENDSVVYDFGNHFVGYVSINFTSKGSHQDAPIFIKLKFCESKKEIDENTDSYDGWISKSWVQEEYVHLDVVPCVLKLPRRYAFRYIRLDVISMSKKHGLLIRNLSVKAVTSAVLDSVNVIGSNDMEKAIDRISLRTLSNCMQFEFEDGPKRDRRLWIGDLRLQALANYETFKNYNLVKRCLYLFGGTINKDGMVSACVFTKPHVQADDTYMFDYSLLFVAALWDYYCATNDIDTVKDLYPIALRQIELASNNFSENNVLNDSEQLGWCFLDWNLTLNKQGGGQAVYIYALKNALKLADVLQADTTWLYDEVANKTKAAINNFYDTKQGLFVSGKVRQISYATNVWFCLAEVFDKTRCAEILRNLKNCKNAVKPVTPYMYHHYIMALINAGCRDEARLLMCEYWGGMVNDGADTFYELYDPKKPDESPYGSSVVNSYCHAWSCTPSYFLRKFFLQETE